MSILRVSPGLKSVAVGTKVMYWIDGAPEAARADSSGGWGTQYQYKWYVFTDWDGKDVGGKEANWTHKGISLTYTWEEVGMYLIVCQELDTSKDLYHPTVVDTFKYDQYVLPASTILARTLKQRQEQNQPLKDPRGEISEIEKRIEVLEAMLSQTKVKSQKAIDDLDQLRTYRENLSQLVNHHSSHPIVPFRAAYLDLNGSKVADLNVFWTKDPSDENCINLVDWTNVLDPRSYGVYPGYMLPVLTWPYQLAGKKYYHIEGVGALEKIEFGICSALRNWDLKNRYYPGAISYEINIGKISLHSSFKTDGKDQWDELAEFMAVLAQGLSIAALVFPPLVELSPALAEALCTRWLVAASVAVDTSTGILNIATRHIHHEDDSRQDVIDALTVIGNLFGAWKGQWKKLQEFKPPPGPVTQTLVLAGEVGCRGIQGFLTAQEYWDKIDKLMEQVRAGNITPRDAEMQFRDIFDEALGAGVMFGIDFRGKTKEFQAHVDDLVVQNRLKSMAGPDGVIDLGIPIPAAGHTREGKVAVATSVLPKKLKGVEVKYAARHPTERGVRFEDDMKLLRHVIEKRRVLILRTSEVSYALRWMGKEGYEGKPFWIKAKTEKRLNKKYEPFQGLAVADPSDPSLMGQLENWYNYIQDKDARYKAYVGELRQLGYEVLGESEGFVIQHKATKTKYYSDYDIAGYYDEFGNRADWHELQFLMNTQGVKVVNHAPLDTFVLERIEDKIAVAPDPKCVVMTYQGSVFETKTIAELQSIYNSIRPGLWDEIWPTSTPARRWIDVAIPLERRFRRPQN